MDQQQAQKIIKETFESSFDKERYINFIVNLLNLKSQQIEHKHPYSGKFIPDTYKSSISTLERIAKYTDGEYQIDILIVKLKKETSLERARTMQRNFIARYLNGSRGGVLKDAALVAYVSPDKDDWRFSLVKMDYKFEKSKTGNMKVKEEFTPARRWSFLVGFNEKSHTAQSRLIKILANDDQTPTLEEIENAFDIETVTREFFQKYRELFMHTKEELDKIVKKDIKVKADFEAKGVDTVNFAKKLLGQIVFLYFLQKKGWFGVGRDDEWGTGSKQFLRELFQKEHSNYKNFYNDILEPLFYEALRIDRNHDDGYYSRFDCKIPFLNGGLFDPIGNYDWIHTDINIADKLFSNTNKTREGDIGNGILDIFDRYNFTVQEDEPLEKEVAIDPELLGKAYEKFNAIRPDNFDEFKKALKSGNKDKENKFNKKFGVYYTPREIVHYMCQQSLINYLDTSVNNAVQSYLPLQGKAIQQQMFGPEKSEQMNLNFETDKPPVPKTDIELLVQTGEQFGENEKTALVKEKNIQNGKQKSSDYKLKLSESIRNNADLLDRKLAELTVCDPAVGSGAFPVGMMNEIVKVREVLSIFLNNKKRSAYGFKRQCIEHSLYGVDIDPGAVEIAKLRLWLSLVVDEQDIKNIKPLPNLDYRIMQGNSLISEFMGINFGDDENKTLKQKITDLSNEKKELDGKIRLNEKQQLQYYNQYNEQDSNLSKTLDTFSKQKKKINNQIAKLNREIANNNKTDSELSEILTKFQLKKEQFLNESNVANKAALENDVERLLMEIFETRLKTKKADYFKQLKAIENKYSVLPNLEQRNEIIKKETKTLNKKFNFNLDAAEQQLKEFTSGRQIKPFFLWNLYFSEVFQDKGGFDVVIANPPYGADIPKEQLKQIKKQTIDTNNSNSAALFIDFAKNKFIQKKGIVAFIVPKSLLYSEKWFSLVKSLHDRTPVLIDVEKGFENVLLEQVVFVYNQSQRIDKYNAFKFNDGLFNKRVTISPSKVKKYRTWLCDVLKSEMAIAEKMTKNNFFLSSISSTTRGLSFQRKLKKSGDIPFIGGKEIQRYFIAGTKGYLKKKDIIDNKKVKKLQQPKLLSQNIVSHIENPVPHIKITSAVDMKGNILSVDTINNTFLNDSDYSLLLILALFNSKLISWYAYRFIYGSAIRTMHFDNHYIGKIPLCTQLKPVQALLISVVKKIILITTSKDYLQNPYKQAKVKILEAEIDQLVYKLYDLTSEEIKIVEGNNE